MPGVSDRSNRHQKLARITLIKRDDEGGSPIWPDRQTFRNRVLSGFAVLHQLTWQARRGYAGRLRGTYLAFRNRNGF